MRALQGGTFEYMSYSWEGIEGLAYTYAMSVGVRGMSILSPVKGTPCVVSVDVGVSGVPDPDPEQLLDFTV